MAIQLYIDDKQVDLSGNENLSVDYAITKIGDIQSRTGARSVQFSLPKTTNNRAIFENPDDVNNLSQVPYRKLKARLYAEGIDQNISFCTLENSGETYNCRLYGNEVGFFDKLKDGMLTDLDLTAHDYYHTLANVVNMRTNTNVCFPLAYNLPHDSAIPLGDIRYMPPGFGVEFLLDKICAYHGYTLHNRMRNRYSWQQSVLVLPFTGDTWKRDNNGSKYNSTWQATEQLAEPTGWVIPYVTRCNFGLVSPPGNYFNAVATASWGGRVLFPDKLKIDYHLTITVDVKAYFFSLAFPMVIAVMNGTEEVHKIEVPQGALSTGTHTYTISGTADIDPQSDSDDACALRVEIAPSTPVSGESSIIDLISATLTISNVQVREATDVITDVSTMLSRQFCTPGTALPAVSQSNLLKAYCQMFCAVVQVNESNKTITIIPFNDIASGVHQPVDWSYKLDLTETPIVKSSPDSYGQLNTFNWNYDGTFEPHRTGFAKGTIAIANTNLEDEVDAVEVPFSATDYILRDNFSCAHVLVYDTDGVLAGGADPRIIVMHFYDEEFIYTNGTPGTLTGYGQLPLTHFNGVPLNLHFQNGLLPAFYNQFAAVLQNYKHVECKLRLTATDINQLDFSRPVFIKYFNAYFYLSAVKGYSPNNPGSSTVELVKLF